MLLYYVIAVGALVLITTILAVLGARSKVKIPTLSGNYAPCYDFRTHTVSYIHSERLKPGMVQARIHNLEGLFWVDPAQMKQEKYQHGDLGAGALAALAVLESQLREVHPLSVEQWQDRFRREADPEREIASWERIAETYTREASSPALNLNQKRDIFQVIIACANGDRKNALSGVTLNALAKTTASQIVERFFAATPAGTDPGAGGAAGAREGSSAHDGGLAAPA